MVGFGTAGNSSSSGDTSINARTGFRSSVPEFMGIDNTYQQPVPITFDLKPNISVESIDYTVDPLGNDNDNGSSQAAIDNKLNYIDDYNKSIVSEEDNPTGGMTQANIDNPVANPTDFYGNPIAKEVNSPIVNPLDFIPGFGLMNTLSGPAVPTSGYGTPGTYSGLTGDRFSADSRGIDTITGQYTNEYGTKGAFLNSFMNDPLGDADKAEQNNLRDMEYAAARSELASLKSGTTDPTGNPATTGLDDAAADKVATQLGLDKGFAAHIVAPGTATHEAIKYNTYVPGSQWSPTGTFTNAGTAAPPVEVTPVSYVDDTSTPAVSPSYNDPAPQQSYSNDSGQDSHGNDNNTGGGGSNDYGGMFNKGGLVTTSNGVGGK